MWHSLYPKICIVVSTILTDWGARTLVTCPWYHVQTWYHAWYGWLSDGMMMMMWRCLVCSSLYCRWRSFCWGHGSCLLKNYYMKQSSYVHMCTSYRAWLIATNNYRYLACIIFLHTAEFNNECTVEEQLLEHWWSACVNRTTGLQYIVHSEIQVWLHSTHLTSQSRLAEWFFYTIFLTKLKTLCSRLEPPK